METIHIHVAFAEEPIQIDVAKDTTVEDAIVDICKALGIGPVARVLFCLNHPIPTGVAWLDLSQEIIKTERRDFNFAMRYNVVDTDELKRIDKVAYDFYFKQARYNIMGDSITSKEYDEHKGDIMGLSIIDMFRATIEDGLTREEVLENYKQYIPLAAIRRHKMFLKRPVMEKFDEIKVRNVSPLFVKSGYLEQFKKVLPDYLKEEYSAIDKSDGDNMHEVIIRVNPFDQNYPGISIRHENKEEWEHICSIEEICYIMKPYEDGTVMICRKTGVPHPVKFHNPADTSSFISLLDGYYRLLVKWMFNICYDYEAPSLKKLRRLKCHGPVGAEFAYKKLKEKKQNKPGCYIVRESDLAFDTYYVDICTKPSKLPITYKIEMTAEGKYKVIEFEREYSSLTQLLKEETWGNPDIVLKECAPPSEYDEPVILYSRSPDGYKKGMEGMEDDVEPVNTTACINSKNLMVFKNTPLEGNNPFTTVYRSVWRESKTVKRDVALKVLRESDQKCLTEFLTQTNRWAAVNSGTIVKLHGLTICNPVSMVMEYLPLGQLDKYLADPHNRLDMTEVILVEAAKCLANSLYHLEEAKFVHGNIRCRKLMVAAHTDTTFNVKLADPGLYSSYKDIDIHWIPPEFHDNMVEARSSVAADVWAFATTLWEIFSYGDTPPSGNAFTIKKYYKDHKLLNRPAACPRILYLIMVECWNSDVDSRKKPQAIMRDINQLFYQVFNRRKGNKYDVINPRRPAAPTVAIPPTAETADEFDFQIPQPQYNGDILVDDKQMDTSTWDTILEPSGTDSTSSDEVYKKIVPQDPAGDNYTKLPQASPATPENRDVHTNEDNIYSLNSIQSIFELDNEYSVILKGRIGMGFYGEVYKAELVRLFEESSKPQIVAAKKVKKRSGASADFKKEIKMMMNLNHTNIVKFKGIIQEPDLILILEYVEYGSLKNYLLAYKERLGPKNLLKFSLDMAMGMKYLTDMRILHRDLAARNILVANEYSVKISDFGLARFIPNDDYYHLKHDRNFPLQWYAPETLEFRKFSHQSDVWSYGVTLWEMFSFGAEPILPNLNEDSHVDEILKALKQNIRLPMPCKCPQFVYANIIVPCWNLDAHSRPSFDKLCAIFRNLYAPSQK